MKRFAAFCMTLLLLAALTACGAKPDTAQPDGGAEPPAGSTAEPLPPVEPAPAEPPAEEPPEAPATEAEGPYGALLRRYYTLVADPDGFSNSFADGEFGVIQDAWFMEDYALDAVGYAITDLSGDGIPELVVGLLPEYGATVDAVYTLVDGEPRFVLEGWSENSYSYIGDGTFYYYGYGWSDVREAGQGFFALTEDGTELVCQEFYFTSLQEEFSDVPVYTNTTGSWEPSKSQETEMSSEDFWAWAPEYEKLPMTPFSAFDFVRAAPQVSVQFAPEGGDYDEVVLNDGPGSCRLLFTADSAVEYFTLLELTLEDVAEDGTMKFTDYPAVLNTPLDSLSPEQPVVVQLVLGENIPNYGIAYVDTHGNMRRFTLELSGKDGSILLQETDPDCFEFVVRGGE